MRYLFIRLKIVKIVFFLNNKLNYIHSAEESHFLNKKLAFGNKKWFYDFDKKHFERYVSNSADNFFVDT